MENKLPDSYRIILKGGVGEIQEKKSRFICSAGIASTEEEAMAFIGQVRKKYWDARHNCSAFVLGKRQELTRCSDDGEPSGTAGRPMLDVLLNEGLCDTVVVVTRYFGGTLLGTGGLVRAYTKAVQAGLEQSEPAWMRRGKVLQIATDYSLISRIQYYIGNAGYEIVASEYTEEVRLDILVPYYQKEDVKKELTELTGAKALLKEKEERYYLDRGGKPWKKKE